MIKVTESDKPGIFNLKVYSEDNFAELNMFFRKREILWNQKERVRKIPGTALLKFYKEMEDYEPIKFIPSKEYILARCKKTLEVKKRRFRINNDLYKFPPIKGKPPYEDFQSDCIIRGCEYNRYAFYVGMGAGKTYVSVNIFNQLNNIDKVGAALIVCVPEVLYNWRHEILKFNSVGITSDDIYVVDKKNRTPFESDKKIVIVTYRMFVAISDKYYKLKKKKASRNYKKVDIGIDNWFRDKPRMLIIDESQRIKNRTSRGYKCLNMQKHHFENRYLLTGTPMPKGYADLYSQMKILDPNLIDLTYQQFANWIGDTSGGYSEYDITKYKPDKVEEFIQQISPYVTRLDEEDILDLPELKIRKNYCFLTGDQLEIYKETIKKTLAVIKNDKGKIEYGYVKKHFAHIMSSLHNPDILKRSDNLYRSPELDKLLIRWDFKKHGKMEVLTSLLEKYIKEEKQRVLIWSTHPETIDYISKHFEKYKPYKIHGATKNKEETLNNFKKDKESKILVANTQCLSTGVNITECTRVIYFDRSYNFELFKQSLKRTHRHGQLNEVTTNILLFDVNLELDQDEILEDRNKINKDSFKESQVLKKDDIYKIFGEFNGK